MAKHGFILRLTVNYSISKKNFFCYFYKHSSQIIDPVFFYNLLLRVLLSWLSDGKNLFVELTGLNDYNNS